MGGCEAQHIICIMMLGGVISCVSVYKKDEALKYFSSSCMWDHHGSC